MIIWSMWTIIELVYSPMGINKDCVIKCIIEPMHIVKLVEAATNPGLICYDCDSGVDGQGSQKWIYIVKDTQFSGRVSVAGISIKCAVAIKQN